MKGLNLEAETKYRLSVILLDNIFSGKPYKRTGV